MSLTESPETEPGLRERKRAAARAALERIAVDLAVEHGYDGATVDAICSAGMISHRTFFNYFGSKEGVFLGASQPLPSEQAIEAFVHDGSDNIVSDLLEAITTMFLDKEVDHDFFLKRRRLIQTTPELTDALMIRMRDSEDVFVAIILRRFAHDGRTDADEAEARMVMALAMGVVHFMMREWFEAGFETAPNDLRATAIALVQRVLAPQTRRTSASSNMTTTSSENNESN